jgi:NADP-dependent 3-hydroxy acid dehydrogenase YdfG
MSKVIVITGASSGIGAATAQLLAKRGHSLALAARSKDVLEKVAQDCGGNAIAVVTDVTDRAQVDTLVSRTIDHLGAIDVWINNAGQGITREPSQLTDEDVDTMVRVNIKSVLYGMQAILPHFRERNAGHIINISSMLGRMPHATFRSAYTGSKHFVNAITAMIRTEIQQTHPGIQVSLVSPGVVRTAFGENALHGGPDSNSLPYSQSAEEVAEVIAGVIESRAPDVYTRSGAAKRVADYYASIGTDPPAASS